MLVASTPATAGLEVQLPDLWVEVVPIEAMATRATEARPRIVVCATEDASAGLSALLAVRSTQIDARLLFLVPQVAEAERLAALEAGIDEALPLPMSDVELAGRVRILLRRSRSIRSSRLGFADGLELDLDRRELLREGAWVHLRPMEARLLELFARSPGRALTRPQILSRVWGPDHAGDPRTVDVHVRWLRSKIEPDPSRPVWLLTVRGVGYRLEPGPLIDR